MPVDVSPGVVKHYKARQAGLREVKAPKIIIENEKRFVRIATGQAYAPRALRVASFDELRELLGTWCWLNYTYSLDKADSELHWFLEPVAGPKAHPLTPLRPKVGNPQASLLTKALQGARNYPKDKLGDPVVRTCGSRGPGCSGYNTPRTCRLILAALRSVKAAEWKKLVPKRLKLWRQAFPAMKQDELAKYVEGDLSLAQWAFPVLLEAYSKAVEKDWGVSCEYSL